VAEDPRDEATPTDAPGSDAAILAEILADYDYDVENLAKIREEAAIDVRYASNDTWDEDDKAARQNRPMLCLDQLSQYRNQVENTVRQNKRAVKVSQAGGGATEKTAELRANRIREIEYQSHAQEAYSQAFSDCLTRGYGFARIIAEYEDEETDNQVFRTKAIPNPDQVIPDSDGQSTSGRDWKRCVFRDSLSHADFKRDYPDSAIKDFDADTLARGGKWMTPTRVQVAEAWRLIETPNRRGSGRPTREVCMYLTNGIELLAKKGQPAKHPWKGKYIPFAMCAGRIVYKSTGLDGESEKMIFSYIRFARHAAKGYNWTKSTLLEKIALPVKASLMGYRGQADVETLALIERASKEHIPWLEFSPTTEATGQQILPLPQYGTREPDIQADLMAAEGFQRDIQNSLGHFNASDARMGHTKVTSGVALAELKRSGDLGSYDFLDHYDDFQKFMGEQYDDLLSSYDDTVKEVAIRKPDGTPEMVTINQKTGKAPDGSPAYGPNDNPMDLGRHTITIATAPATDSEREAHSDFADHVIDSPQIAQIVGPEKAAALLALAIKLKGAGTIGDEMADIISPPPQQDGAPPDPKQLLQQLEQMQQQLKQLEGIAQQLDQEIKSKQAEAQAKKEIAQA
jgi:hypothetical protein